MMTSTPIFIAWGYDADQDNDERFAHLSFGGAIQRLYQRLDVWFDVWFDDCDGPNQAKDEKLALYESTKACIANLASTGLPPEGYVKIAVDTFFSIGIYADTLEQ